MAEHTQSGVAGLKGRGKWIGAAVAIAILVGLLGLFRGGGDSIAPGTTFVAKRGNLDITVVEGGSIEALESQEIRSQIEGRSGIKILSIVEEGYLVTREDIERGIVLVELDSSELRDQLVNQEISFQSAEAQFIEKQAQFDIQLNQNQSNISAAELNAKFALMDFEKYLGKKAVTDIVENLRLHKKAAELRALKAQGGIRRKLPTPKLSAITRGFIDPRADTAPDDTFGERGRRDFREPRMQSSDGAGPHAPHGGAEAGGGSGWGGGPPSPEMIQRMRERGGGMGGGMGGGRPDPEMIRRMVEANGGRLPDQMAEGIRQMGGDPDEMLRMIMSGSGPPPPLNVEPEVESWSINLKPAFTAEPAYVKVREAIDFTGYANAEILEDGEAKQTLRHLEDQQLVTREDLRLAETRLEGQERLAARNFITQNDLDLERVKVEKARIQLASSKTESNLFVQYTFQKEAESLLSDYEEGLMNLERTMQEAGAKLSQAEAGLRSAERKYNLEAEKMADLQDQIEKCVIRAERPGLVVYGSSTDKNPWRRSSEEPIQEGTTVRERQKIITIPDTTQMGVTVNIHESVVQKIELGQTARITVDAFPDRPLTGSVDRVAVLADSANMFMNPDLKVYPTAVRIDGEHDWLRPGMSTQVQILISGLIDVVYIPIQAVTYLGDRKVCFVVVNGVTSRRTIETGAFTEDFIVVTKGLEEGEEVRLLAPNVGEQESLQSKDAGDAEA